MIKSLRLRCRFINTDRILFYEGIKGEQIGVCVKLSGELSCVRLSKNQVRLLRNWCNNWLREQR